MFKAVIVFLAMSCVLAYGGGEVRVSRVPGVTGDYDLGNGVSYWRFCAVNTGKEPVTFWLQVALRWHEREKQSACLRQETVMGGETRMLTVSLPWHEQSYSKYVSMKAGTEDGVFFSDSLVLCEEDENAAHHILMTQAVHQRLAWWNGWGGRNRESQCPAAEWPSDPRFFLNFDAVWMTPGEHGRLPSPTRQALVQFQRLGGTLVLCGLPEGDGRRTVSSLSDVVASQEPVGLGWKLELSDGLLFVRLLAGEASFGTSPGKAAQRSTLATVPWQGDKLTIGWDLLPNLTMTVSRDTIMLVSLGLFVLLVVLGPGLLFMYHRQHPLKVFAVTPVVSFGVCGLVLVIWLLTSHSVENVASFGVAFLEQSSGEFVSCNTVCCNKLSLEKYALTHERTSRLEVDSEVNVLDRGADDGGRVSCEIDNPQVGQAVHYRLYAFGKWKGRLEISFQGEECIVENGLGAAVEACVVVGMDGSWYSVPRLGVGERASCRPSGRLGEYRNVITKAQLASLAVADTSGGTLEHLCANGVVSQGMYACVVKDSICVDTGKSMPQGAQRVLLLGKY